MEPVSLRRETPGHYDPAEGPYESTSEREREREREREGDYSDTFIDAIMCRDIFIDVVIVIPCDSLTLTLRGGR